MWSPLKPFWGLRSDPNIRYHCPALPILQKPYPAVMGCPGAQNSTPPLHVGFQVGLRALISTVPYDVGARFCGKANFVHLAFMSGRAIGLGLLVSGRWPLSNTRYTHRA